MIKIKEKILYIQEEIFFEENLDSNSLNKILDILLENDNLNISEDDKSSYILTLTIETILSEINDFVETY